MELRTSDPQKVQSSAEGGHWTDKIWFNEGTARDAHLARVAEAKMVGKADPLGSKLRMLGKEVREKEPCRLTKANSTC